jgi:Inner membrane protein CreD
MSMKKVAAIALIFLVACAGWWTLGMTTAQRSTDYGKRLSSAVQALWGVPLVQKAPTLAVEIPGTDQVRWVMPSSNDVKARLKTDYRKKGLIWYPTYICDFDGTYTMTNTEEVAQKLRVHFDFPAPEGTYDAFAASIGDKKLVSAIDTREGVADIVELPPGESVIFQVKYRTRGIREWRYAMDPNVGRVQNLDLTVETDFREVDYPEGCLSPMSNEETSGGMKLAWKATDLITRESIGVIIPEKINPGPLTSRITFFAPVCLVFFFVLVATINILYKINIHPMHYLFVAAGFFAFHLLLAYMAGHVHIHLAFAISTIVSVGLVTSYMAAALKGQFPWKVAVAGQLFFLVLFSYTFFLEGITGLTVAIGSVATLGVLMKVTAQVDWDEVFARAKKKPTPPPLPSSDETAAEAT